MITINNLSLSYGERELYKSISFTCADNARMGIVGRNGAGKSTLLKIIAGQTAYDSGLVQITPSTRIAYMPQEVVLNSDRSVLDETLRAFEHLAAAENLITALEKKIDDGTITDDELEQYAHACSERESADPERMRIQAMEVLSGLGFGEERMQMRVNELSVGWKMRIVLAQLLLQKADIYLFDEPTNHLDIVAKDWFISFIKRSNFGFMLICHERYVMDQLCTAMIDLECGNAKVYKGNYTTYCALKDEYMTQLRSSYEQQQRDITRKQATIDRFRASASRSTMAQSMMKSLDKIERIELPPEPKKIALPFKHIQPSGTHVLRVENLKHAFGDKPLFHNVRGEITRAERIALIAANGVGKTTLIRLITGELPVQQGTIIFDDRVKRAVFAQDQDAIFNHNDTIVQAIQARCPKASEQTMRMTLGALLFSGDDINKKIGMLSGGEKNRVAIACVLLQDANMLILDEPTNHLDIPSKEMLLHALKSYPGTILFVSHDHTFVNELATRVLELNNNGLHSYHGNYDSYLDQKKSIQERPIITPPENRHVQTPAPSKPQSSDKLDHMPKEQKKQLHSIEKELSNLELRKNNLERMLSSTDQQSKEFHTSAQQHAQCVQRIQELSRQWEEYYAVMSKQ